MIDIIPDVNFVLREDGKFVTKNSSVLFSNKKVIVFSLPGAFTPTCSTKQLPSFEERFDEFNKHGIDDIYCVSVNDAFVMNSWAKDLNVRKVKLVADGNADFTDGMGMLVDKSNLGFGMRSWRYSALIDNQNIIKVFEEPNKRDNADDDPYEVTDPQTMLNYLTSLTGIA